MTEAVTLLGNSGNRRDVIDHPILCSSCNRRNSNSVFVHHICHFLRVHGIAFTIGNYPHFKPQHVTRLVERKVGRCRDHNVWILCLRFQFFCNPDCLKI